MREKIKKLLVPQLVQDLILDAFKIWKGKQISKKERKDGCIERKKARKREEERDREKGRKEERKERKKNEGQNK